MLSRASFYLAVGPAEDNFCLADFRARSHWAFALAIVFVMSQMQMLKWVLYPISNGVTNANTNANANAQCE